MQHQKRHYTAHANRSFLPCLYVATDFGSLGLRTSFAVLIKFHVRLLLSIITSIRLKSDRLILPHPSSAIVHQDVVLYSWNRRDCAHH